MNQIPPENSNESKESAKEQVGPQIKKPKAQSPLRIEVIIPLLLFTILISFYAHNFLDRHLKSLLEWGATRANGAEVNIDRIVTSLSGASLHIHNIQVTNPKKPEENIFQLGEFALGLNWDALLRAKILIETAKLTDIGVNTIRQRPGRVLPVTERAQGDITEEIRGEILGQVEEEYGGTPIADLANLLDGAELSDQIADISGLLKSEQRIAELRSELQRKQIDWQQSLLRYQNNSPLEEIKSQVNGFRVNTSKPQESVREIKSLLDRSKNEVREITQLQERFRTDLRQVKQTPREIQNLVDEDFRTLRNRLGIPNVDGEGFAMALFGRFFGEMVAEFSAYAEKAMGYMPPGLRDRQEKEAADDKAFRPRPRGEGEDFHFKTTTSYPLFWLREGVISSSAENRAWSGVFKGEFRNFTNRPAEIGKPATLNLTGDILEKEIEGISLQLNLNHHLEQPAQELFLEVKKIPIQVKRFSASDRLSLKMDSEYSRFELKAQTEFKDRFYLDLDFRQQFVSPSFDIASSSRSLKRILDSSFGSLDRVDLSAQAKGPLTRLSWRVQTNMARALERGVRGEIQERIAQEERKLREKIDGKIAPLKADLEAQIRSFENTYQGLIAQYQREANLIENLANRKHEEALKAPAREVQDRAREEIRDRGRDAVDDLRRRIRP